MSYLSCQNIFDGSTKPDQTEVPAPITPQVPQNGGTTIPNKRHFIMDGSLMVQFSDSLGLLALPSQPSQLLLALKGPDPVN